MADEELTVNTACASEETTEKAGRKQKNGKNQDKEKSYGIVGTVYDAVSVIVASMIIISIVFTFCFRLVGVHGPSMNNTLSTGDWLIVTPLYSDPEYGQIVISTKKTAADGNLVKRIIAVAGDEVDIKTDGRVFVNGRELNEPYIISDGTRHGDLSYPLVVPEDCVMLMGDNRPVSWDSRYSEIGFAETEYLMGKAQIRIAVTDATGKLAFAKDRDIYANFDKNANK